MYDSFFFFFSLGFTLHKTEQPFRGMELQESTKEIFKYIRKLFTKNSKQKTLDLKSHSDNTSE